MHKFCYDNKYFNNKTLILNSLITKWRFFLRSSHRSSRSQMFFKTDVLKIFAKFTGKHLWRSLPFDKVSGAAHNFIKIETRHKRFPVNFEKFLRIHFLKKTSGNGFYSHCECSVTWIFWISKNKSQKNLETFPSKFAVKRVLIVSLPPPVYINYWILE